MRRRLLLPNWLGTAGVARLSLRVVGYQFPDLDPVDQHDDWLVMEGIVEDGHDRWRFRDPCLTVDELLKLIAWLDELPTGAPRIDFTEPLVAFALRPERPGMIECCLRGEAVAPVVCDVRERWHIGRVLWLPTESSVRTSFVRRLRADQACFPRHWLP